MEHQHLIFEQIFAVKFDLLFPVFCARINKSRLFNFEITLLIQNLNKLVYNTKFYV